MVLLEEGRRSQERLLPKSNECKQGGEGSKFWSICENEIIKWPLSFSVADRRKFEYPHFQTETKPLTEMLQC